MAVKRVWVDPYERDGVAVAGHFKSVSLADGDTGQVGRVPNLRHVTGQLAEDAADTANTPTVSQSLGDPTVTSLPHLSSYQDVGEGIWAPDTSYYQKEVDEKTLREAVVERTLKDADLLTNACFTMGEAQGITFVAHKMSHLGFSGMDLSESIFKRDPKCPGHIDFF